jgi:hypothetical protein
MQLLSIALQGKISRALLANSRQAVVTGVTSRGIFIKLDTDWILFLSFESFRGPLTLNLFGETAFLRTPGNTCHAEERSDEASRFTQGPRPFARRSQANAAQGDRRAVLSAALSGIEMNCQLDIAGWKIQNLPAGIEIDFSRARTWEAPPQPENLLSPVDRAKSLNAVARLILSQEREPGLYLVLKDLLSLEMDGLQLLPKPVERVDCLQLLPLLKTTDLDGILSSLTPFLGLGAGLTPAGDDMVLGLLLAYNRWGTALKPAFDLAELNDRLCRAASQKTTLLSANLIACASQGQADERLVSALDGLMTGDPTSEQCARSLSGWGNSSGCDALAGMALAITSQQLV